MAIKKESIASFSRELSTLISSNISILESLELIKQNYNGKMEKLIRDIIHDIKSGTQLSQALKKHTKYFNHLFCGLIKAGEESGRLNIMLEKIASYQENSIRLKKRIKKATIYPAVILSIALLVSIVLLVFVVPQFSHMFSEFNAKLPEFTRLILYLSALIQKDWYFILSFTITMLIVFKLLINYSQKFEQFVQDIVIKIPIFGNIIKKSILVKIFSTLAITIESGVPLNLALKLAQNTTNNYTYIELINNSISQIEQGVSFYKTLDNKKIPNKAIALIHIGEQSGNLTTMLNKLSETYDFEINNNVDNLNNLLEPIIMVILGVIIGSLVVGMYLPIFKLGTIL